ncbi:hypothetical protein HCN_1693 [Helicobacter cinaedi PAGU611]|uniref:hypothetical protein n=1 Tax=Helicobacter cinaedi TaxID=213 RepID=UPI00025D33FD|nr:hypothetical protein [Helicobacter cinaedi]BAM12874.1 hypothetical protein HCN_1693 [Helicobacter cinaedi PAGU611]BBB20733.1 hypothetical protein HC081234_19100 [Helicobacter cinaedi]
MEINFTLVSIGTFTGIGSFLILMANFICQRYSFITYIKYQPDTLLLVALYKAATEGYKFIRIGKNIVLIGHTQNNKWIKPYKCVINPFSKSQFLNESEIYTYKIDWTLLLIIKIYKKNKK